MITHVSIPFRQAIIGQCPVGVPVGNCVLLCDGALGDAPCLPPNVCNVFDVGQLVPFPVLPDYNCVPPVATQVNNKLLLHFRACSAYLVTPQDLLTIFD